MVAGYRRNKYGRAAAYHEAGHVVIAWAWSQQVRKVAIGEHDHTLFDEEYFGQQTCAAILLGGGYAEQHFSPGFFHISSCKGDLEELDKIKVELPPHWMAITAMRVRGLILSRCRRSIHQLAKQLLTKHVIYYHNKGQYPKRKVFQPDNLRTMASAVRRTRKR